jgi:hypothetical protein
MINPIQTVQVSDTTMMSKVGEAGLQKILLNSTQPIKTKSGGRNASATTFIYAR